MIKTITLNNVRGIDNTFDLKKLNVFTGKNASGKSTLINMIQEIYKGKTTIKEGTTSIVDDNGLMLQSVNGILPNKDFRLGTNMDLMTPGFFLNGKKIKGVNSTEEEKRKTISEILGIDRDKYFIDNGVNYSIKGLTGDLRDNKIKEDTYSNTILRAESDLNLIKEITMPKEIKLTEGNELELKQLKDGLVRLKESVREVHEKMVVPNEIELISDKLEEGNKKELDKLKKELEEITNEGTNKSNEIKNTKIKEIKKVCECCGQDIKDADKAEKISKKEYDSTIDKLNKELEEITNRYKLKAQEINDFKLIEDKLIKGNSDIYRKTLQDINEAKTINKQIELDEKHNKEVLDKYNKQKDLISKFKLMPSNKEEYEKYTSDLIDYNNKISERNMLEKTIEDNVKLIEELDTNSIQEKIDKYREVENAFSDSIKDKLINKDLEIIFYRELSTPNAAGEMFASTFNIKYKGKLYNECSGGEQVIIDVLISKMFIDYYKSIDFILIDQAELSTENLKLLINDYLKDYQIITTRIGKGELTLSYNL